MEHLSLLLPLSPFLAHLNLDIHATRQTQTLQTLYCFEGRLGQINQPTVRAHFELITGILLYERRTVHGELPDVRGEGNGPVDDGAAAFGSFDDLERRFIEHRMIERAQADANAGFREFFFRQRLGLGSFDWGLGVDGLLHGFFLRLGSRFDYCGFLGSSFLRGLVSRSFSGG